MTEPREARKDEPTLTDAEKLRVLAAWFDMWDRPETDRQAILDEPRNPGRNDVQLDLHRIADELDALAVSAALASPAPTASLRAAFVDALATAWEQANAVSAGETRNAAAIVSNIEERFKAFIPDWREAAAEAARRSPLSPQTAPETE